MATPGDAAALFAVPNLDRRGLWELSEDTEAAGFFSPAFGDMQKPDDIDPPNAGFFTWPAQDSQSADTHSDSLPSNSNSPPDPLSPPNLVPNPIENDKPTDWLDYVVLDPPAAHPQYQTWDGLLNQTTSPPPLFLSEAGPGAYDAAIAEATPPSDRATVIQSKVYFASLLALAMGRESVLFRRLESAKFEPVLAKIRIPGHSHQVLQGLQTTCLRCGRLTLSLRAHVEAMYGSQPSQCSVALAGVIDKVLLLIQSTVGPYGQSHDSALELQAMVQRVLVILSAFYDLAKKLPPSSSDKKIIDVVFAQADVANSQGGAMRDMMLEVLCRVSRPWVEFLEEWVGLRRETGIPFTLSDVGRQKYFVRVESEDAVDSEGLDITETDFHLDMESMPKCVPVDVSRQLFEAGRHLRFIRANHPEHALSRLDMPSLGPPSMNWLFDWGSVLERENQVAAYRSTLADAVSRGVTQPQRLAPPVSSGWSLFDATDADIERQILQSMEMLSQPVAPQPAHESDVLSWAVQRQLLPPISDPHTLADQTPHWSLLPVLSFGPVVAVQSAIINRESLRLLFNMHHLGDHLDRLRGFYLLGNSWFCRRMSHALFDPNMDSAERKAGVVMHAGASMGLRLGMRSTWPPASSELRLALMGLLSESQTNQEGPTYKEGHPLGEMSFSVRQLPQVEVDKVLDPTSLQALDFLRLSYQPPEVLALILSPSAILKCDTVFKLLLRMLRMQFVVGQISRQFTCRTALEKPRNAAALRFASAANHFVTTLSAYFVNTAIAEPWRDFSADLGQIRAAVSSPDSGTSPTLPGPDRIRNDLQQVLDKILEGLFLRKRQQPVMKLLEEILSLILEFAKRQQPRYVAETSFREYEAMYAKLRQNVHLFITVCRGLADESRGRKSRLRIGGDGHVQESVIGRLVCLLDYSAFYGM